MSYDFNERTDEPKRYCQLAKLSQQKMPKTEEPRCRYCCERLIAGGNWMPSDSRNGSCICAVCSSKVSWSCKLQKGGGRAVAIKNNSLTRRVAVQLKHAAKQRGKIAASGDEIEAEIKRFLQIGCAMCGRALHLRGEGERGPQEGCLQIDRIDPREGYVVGNMQGLCPECNRRKADHTLESAERLYKHLLAHEYKRKYGFELHHFPIKRPVSEPPEVPTRG